jgi:hypothetical protein
MAKKCRRLATGFEKLRYARSRRPVNASGIIYENLVSMHWIGCNSMSGCAYELSISFSFFKSREYLALLHIYEHFS